MTAISLIYVLESYEKENLLGEIIAKKISQMINSKPINLRNSIDWTQRNKENDIKVCQHQISKKKQKTHTHVKEKKKPP